MKKTLIDISKLKDKLLKMIEFSTHYKKGEFNDFKNSYNAYLAGISKIELISAFIKDIKSTAKTLYEIQYILEHTDGKYLTELNEDRETIEDIFGEFYDKEKKEVILSGIKFPLGSLNKIAKKDIETALLKDIMDLELKDFNKLIKNNNLYSTENPIEYLANIDNRNLVDEIVKKIEEKVLNYVDFRKSLSKIDKKVIDKDITFNRTMIDGVIQNSTYITQNGLNQIASSHKKQKDKAEELAKLLKNSKYISELEIDKDADIDRIIQTIKQIKVFNIALNKKVIFKVRKLGNYKIQGAFIPSLNMVVVDINSPSSIIHELFHAAMNEADQNIKNKMIEHFIPKVELTLEQLSKEDYYKDGEEILARLGEIGALLEFEELKEKGFKFEENSIAMIKDKEFYNMDHIKGIYFNYNSLPKEDKELILNFYRSVFRLDKNLMLENLPENFTPSTKLKRINNNLKSLYRLKDKNFEQYYNYINGKNIDDIIELNTKLNLISPIELTETILTNITKIGEYGNRLYANEWADMMANKAKIINTILNYIKPHLSDVKMFNLYKKYILNSSIINKEESFAYSGRDYLKRLFFSVGLRNNFAEGVNKNLKLLQKKDLNEINNFKETFNKVRNIIYDLKRYDEEKRKFVYPTAKEIIQKANESGLEIFKTNKNEKELIPTTYNKKELLEKYKVGIKLTNNADLFGDFSIDVFANIGGKEEVLTTISFADNNIVTATKKAYEFAGNYLEKMEQEQKKDRKIEMEVK